MMTPVPRPARRVSPSPTRPEGEHPVKFSYDLSYDAAPDEVHAMLTDPAFRESVCARGGALEHRVEVTPAGAGPTVVVDQTLPARNIPSFAQKIVGERIQIVQREDWADAHAADLDVSMPGKPGQVTGRIELAAEAAGTRETVSGEVKVSLPLVGGKLEKLIADMLGAALRNEHRVGRAWLAGDR